MRKAKSLHQRIVYIVVFVVACCVGILGLRYSGAATLVVGSEAENGAKTCGAISIDDTAASNGSGVRFNSGCGNGGSDPLAALPRVPWSGGPSYYQKYSKPAAFGWTSPNFFPLAEWLPCTNDSSELGKDMAAGINVSAGLCNSGNYSLLRSKGMSVFADGGKNPNQGAETVGYFLDDEVDGRMGAGWGPTNSTFTKCNPDIEPLHCGYTAMQRFSDDLPSNGQFMRYANYTGGVSFGNSNDAAVFLDRFQEVVSVDNYFYSGPGNTCYVSKVAGMIPEGRCPRAANYGTVMRHLQDVDAIDGIYHPIWNFVELGRTGDQPGIKPDQAVGAAWSSIINGAMGIIYFIEGTGDGPCGMPGNILRDPCSESAAVTAAITVGNKQIQTLAPVLNTQSYKWSFHPKLDTMLKAYNGSYYIFAMLNQSGDPGSFIYELPSGLAGSKVEVVDENRTLTISTARTFTDSFAAEYTHHIYKITP